MKSYHRVSSCLLEDGIVIPTGSPHKQQQQQQHFLTKGEAGMCLSKAFCLMDARMRGAPSQEGAKPRARCPTGGAGGWKRTPRGSRSCGGSRAALHSSAGLRPSWPGLACSWHGVGLVECGQAALSCQGSQRPAKQRRDQELMYSLSSRRGCDSGRLQAAARLATS